MERKYRQYVWNAKKKWVVRSKKQTEWDTVVHYHARGSFLLSIDSLEDEKKDLITNGTCVMPWWRHALEWLYNMTLYERFSMNKCNKLDHPWWLTMQSLWGMGQLWKIITRWMIQWESNETMKKNHGTSSRGGATMQTSPCRVFKSPSLSYLI